MGPYWVAAGIGVVFGSPGAPRCQVALANATAALSWLRGGSWGLLEVFRRRALVWHGVHRWARDAVRRGTDAPAARGIAAILVIPRPDCGPSQAAQLRGAGAAVYRGAWRARCERRFRAATYCETAHAGFARARTPSPILFFSRHWNVLLLF